MCVLSETKLLAECETDIALLTETWLKDDDQVVMNKITPPGFTLKYKNRTTKRGGGVAVLHKSHLNLYKAWNFSEFEYIELSSKKPSFVIVLLYRPPLCGKNISKFLDEFDTLMTALAVSPSKMLVAGDLNLHEDNMNEDDAGRLNQILIETSFEQIIHVPTHKHEHTLDWILTRSTD